MKTPARKKEPPEQQLAELAERFADSVFARLLDLQEAEGDDPDGDIYDPLLTAAGVDLDELEGGSDEEDRFAKALPTDELKQAFDRIVKQQAKQQVGYEQAAYSIGLAIGRRLARLEGGVR